jgi:hypothetical protein
LILGTLWSRLGYAVIPAIVIGSLLASHTLIGLIVRDLGATRLEPVIVMIGAMRYRTLRYRLRDLRPCFVAASATRLRPKSSRSSSSSR